MSVICPTCSSSCGEAARYCPDCYTVFASKPASVAPAVKNSGFKGTAASVTVIAAAIVWFGTLDAEPWMHEEGSFSAAAAGAKRKIVVAVSSVGGAQPYAPSAPAGKTAQVGGRLRSAAVVSEWKLLDSAMPPCPAEYECSATVVFETGETAAVKLRRAGAGIVLLKGNDDHSATLLSLRNRAEIVEAGPAHVPVNIAITRLVGSGA